MKSTVHGIQSGGDSDYFQRPTGGTMKAAVVMSGDQAHIKILDSSYDFGTSMSNSDVAFLSQVSDVSMFQLG